MTTLTELFQSARAGNARAAIKISDTLRSRGLTYKQIAAIALDKGIAGPEWEALLLEGDWEEESP